MKVLVIGDIHMRVDLPYSSTIEDGRKAEWTGVLDKIIKTAEECDVVVLLGDILNSRNNPSVVLKELVEFLKRFGDKQIYAISGNHETTTGRNTALDFLQRLEMPNWHFYTSITQNIQLTDRLSATFIPYTLYSVLGATTKEGAEKILIDSLKPADVSFSHHAFAGGKSTEFFNSEIVLDKDKMSKLFGMNFFGHIHRAELLSPNVQGTGSVFPQEIGEYGKSIWVWDSETKMTKEVPLPVRQIRKIVWEERDDKETIPSNSIVKCYVTNHETNLDDVRKFLSFFDGSTIVEQYPSERVKIEAGDEGLDLSTDSMLRKYAENRGLVYSDLLEGIELIKQ